LKPSSETYNSNSKLKVTSEAADMGQFSTGSINKTVPSFRNSLIEYVKGDGRHSEHD